MNIIKTLNSEFQRRKSNNPRYSLRSFATFLEIDPTALSRIMREERVASPATCIKILKKLQLWENQLPEQFPQPKRKRNPLKDSFDQEVLESVFQKEHVVVLTALRLNSLPFSEIKNKLRTECGMDNDYLEEVIRDLYKIGAVTKSSRGMEVTYKNKSTVPLMPFTSQKLKSMQKEFLEEAIQAVDQVPLEKRMNATLTVALDTKDLVKVKEILNEARVKINKLCEKRRTKNALYNICTAAYPVISQTEGH